MLSILIAGSGGQGVLFLGKIIVQGAMMEGRQVTWFPSYGAEMRGGTANCTVIISDEVIGSPIVKDFDMAVAMNEASMEKFIGRLKPGGLMVVDSSLVKATPGRSDVGLMRVPASEIAASVGNAKAANMVMLGALVSEGVLKEASALGALAELTHQRKRSTLDMNRKAISEGKAYCEDKKN
jgi:2-oxoglutarate ferredoxin oxidoreductase subunit gamma